MQRHGAPSDIGRSKDFSKNFKAKSTGSLGNWKDGVLSFSRSEIQSVTGKKFK